MRTTSRLCGPISRAQRRTASSTAFASGHLNTDELKDLTGIAYCLFALQSAVMLERCSLRMTIGIAGCNVIGVQYVSYLNELLGSLRGFRKLPEEPGNDLVPSSADHHLGGGPSQPFPRPAVTRSRPTRVGRHGGRARPVPNPAQPERASRGNGSAFTSSLTPTRTAIPGRRPSRRGASRRVGLVP